MHYRLYQPGDFAQLYAIELVCFQPPLRFPRRYMRQLIESPESATWIAEEEEKIAEEERKMCGFAIVEWTLEPGHEAAYIPTLEVSPDHRRRGIGLELLRRLERSAADSGASLIWLHVDPENEPALRLYRAEGYRLQGRHEHYYARHRAAEVYSKPLVAVADAAVAGSEQA